MDLPSFRGASHLHLSHLKTSHGSALRLAAPGCLVVALTHVVVKQAKLITESTAQCVFVMQRGKAVPTGAEEAMEIMCIHKAWLKQSTPTTTARAQHAHALPAFSSSTCLLPVLSGTPARSTDSTPCFLSTSCLLHPAEPSQNRCRSITLSWNGTDLQALLLCLKILTWWCLEPLIPCCIWSRACRAGLLLCFEILLQLRKN